MGGSKAPSPRNPAKDYKKGIKVYLEYLPQMLAAEEKYRAELDPQRVQSSLDLQNQFGEQQANQQLDLLNKIDPQSVAVRGELGSRVLSDLESGYELPEDFSNQLQNEILGSQAARGNILGNSAGLAEAAMKGRAAYDMYQRKIANAGSFLSTRTPQDNINALNPIRPDRSSAYTSQSAGPMGVGWGQNLYSQQMQGYQAQQAAGNPWANALGGAASGAAMGSVAGVPGAVVGGVVGGVAGYYSDRALKENISKVAERKDGIGIYEFNYRGQSERYRGLMADDVERVRPGAVRSLGGFKWVDYNSIGATMEAV